MLFRFFWKTLNHAHYPDRAQLLSEAQEADHAAKVPLAVQIRGDTDGTIGKFVKKWLVHQQLWAYQSQLDVYFCVQSLVS